MKSLVIVNQAANYLTIGLANAFGQRFEEVILMTGSIHVQGEKLRKDIKWQKIRKWRERHGIRKAWVYMTGLIQIYFLLLFRYRKSEVFFISLPPMAYLLNIILPHRFSMMIWDLFPDTLKVAGVSEKSFLFRIWSSLNKRSFPRSYKLFTIGRRTGDSLARYVNADKVIISPIWSIFQQPLEIPFESNPFVIEQNLYEKFIVQYSGNIGLGHNVELIIDLAEKMRDQTDVLFQIIGRGHRVPILRKLVKERKLQNCQFLPFQTDEMFPYSLSAAHIGVVILNEAASTGSVPSKSFNLMSLGIPSLYFASETSELMDYVKKYKHGLCLDGKEIDKARNFILLLKSDKNIYQQYRHNSLLASQDFKRSNADAIVEKYLTA